MSIKDLQSIQTARLDAWMNDKIYTSLTIEVVLDKPQAWWDKGTAPKLVSYIVESPLPSTPLLLSGLHDATKLFFLVPWLEVSWRLCVCVLLESHDNLNLQKSLCLNKNRGQSKTNFALFKMWKEPCFYVIAFLCVSTNQNYKLFVSIRNHPSIHHIFAS